MHVAGIEPWHLKKKEVQEICKSQTMAATPERTHAPLLPNTLLREENFDATFLDDDILRGLDGPQAPARHPHPAMGEVNPRANARRRIDGAPAFGGLNQPAAAAFQAINALPPAARRQVLEDNEEAAEAEFEPSDEEDHPVVPKVTVVYSAAERTAGRRTLTLQGRVGLEAPLPSALPPSLAASASDPCPCPCSS